MLERIRGLMFVLKPVIDPFRPALSRALFTLLGIIIGIFLVYQGGFGLVDVEWRDAEPVNLQESWQEQWVKNAALAHQYYLENGVSDPESLNDSTAQDLQSAGYDSAKVQDLAEANQDNPVVSEALLTVAELPNKSAADAKTAQISTSFLDTIGPCLCVFFWLLILVLVGIALSFKPLPIGKWKKGPVVRDDRTEGIADAERNRRLAAKEAQELAKAAAAQAAVDYGKPEATFTSTYVLGDDHFSYSYPIEPGGGFAGEVGIEIGKTIGEGSPKMVTAFDVFAFDQKDIQTLTYLIVSEHAYVDDTLRTQLAPRAEEMIVPQQGESFVMETRNLRMKVQILQMEYGEGSLPPNSFFGKLIVQLTVWVKEGGSDSGMGEGLSAMPPLPRPVMDMPPMPPAPATEQRPPMATPLAPPPMPPQGQQPPMGGGFAPPPPPPQPLTSNQPQNPFPPASDPFGGQQPPLPPQRQPGPGAGAPPPPPPRPPAGQQHGGMSAPPPPPPRQPGAGVPPPPPPRPPAGGQQGGFAPPPPPPRPQGQQPGIPTPPPPPFGQQPDDSDLDDPFGDTTNM